MRVIAPSNPTPNGYGNATKAAQNQALNWREVRNVTCDRLPTVYVHTFVSDVLRLIRLARVVASSAADCADDTDTRDNIRFEER